MDQPVDDTATAFPASETTPGQAESRNAYQQFIERDRKPEWWEDYEALRAEGWDWRKAAFIAWEAAPALGRWPATQMKLAQEVLGLKSDRTIQKWRENDPAIDERVMKFRAAPFFRHLRDIIDASVAVAMTPTNAGTPERKMVFEMTGLYKPKTDMTVSGKSGEPVEVKFDVSGIPIDLLRSLADEGDETSAAPGGPDGTGPAGVDSLRAVGGADVQEGTTP